MYRIEYDIETGLVHNLTAIEDASYPETLLDGVVYYEGDIPEDREGYTKSLFWGYDDNQNSRVASPYLYAVYTLIEGWLEIATIEGIEPRFADLESRSVSLESGVATKAEQSEVDRLEQGIDAKIATKANQSDLVQLEQDVKPSNAGIAGQVLTKTSTGQEWANNTVGIDVNMMLTNMLNNGCNGIEIDTAIRYMVDKPAKIYGLYRTAATSSSLFNADWSRSITEIEGLFISASNTYNAHWNHLLTIKRIGIVYAASGVTLSGLTLGNLPWIEYIRIVPNCIRVADGGVLNMDSFAQHSKEKFDDESLSSVINGLGTVTTATFRISNYIKGRLTNDQINSITNKGWTILSV